MTRSSQSIHYFRLRKQVFIHEVKHWLKQVEHLFILTVIFLGTALPALFYGALLGYGIVLDNTASSLHSLMIIWSLLVVQSIILQLCASAILGSRYLLFLQSVEPRVLKQRAIDIYFGLLCSPLLIMLGFILGSIESLHWGKFLHGFVLFALQFALSIVCLYKPKVLVWFLGLSLVAVIVLGHGLELTLISCLYVLIILLVSVYILLPFLHRILAPNLRLLPSRLTIWLSMTSSSTGSAQGARSITKPNALLMFIGFITILMVMGKYASINLPEYTKTVQFITGQFLVLACASLQLSINKTLQRYSYFFAQYMPSGHFNLTQYWVSIVAALCTFFAASLLFSSSLLLSHMLALLFCLMFIKRYASYFMLVWLVSTGLLGLFVFWV